MKKLKHPAKYRRHGIAKKIGKSMEEDIDVAIKAKELGDLENYIDNAWGIKVLGSAFDILGLGSGEEPEDEDNDE